MSVHKDDWVVALAADELPSGDRKVIQLGAEGRVTIYRHIDGTLYALRERCVNSIKGVIRFRMHVRAPESFKCWV